MHEQPNKAVNAILLRLKKCTCTDGNGIDPRTGEEGVKNGSEQAPPVRPEAASRAITARTRSGRSGCDDHLPSACSVMRSSYARMTLWGRDVAA